MKRTARKLNLLLVEDERADAELFKELVASLEIKFSCTHVQDLAMAIAATETRSFDCIVLDLNLPDSRGIATYRIMRRHALETAIVILTGQPQREDMMEALRLGADNYLIKGTCNANRIAVAIMSALRDYTPRLNNLLDA